MSKADAEQFANIVGHMLDDKFNKLIKAIGELENRHDTRFKALEERVDRLEGKGLSNGH